MSATTDPRIARSTAAIIEAATELLLDGGVHAITVDAIAERSGVSKATIYRHWDSRQDLILDALLRLKPAHPVPDHGDVRSDLVHLLSGLREHLASPAAAAFTSMAGAAEHDPELARVRQEYTAARRSPMVAVVERAIARGELPTDLDVDRFIASIVGPLFYRRVVQGLAVPADWAEATVDAVLAGCSGRGTDTAS
jgi:AcrR family transcriptional regulator